MKKLGLATTTAILLLGTAGPAYAEVVPLGYKEFTGPRPYVYFSPDTLERAESFEVVVSADPAQDLDYKHYISCTRGSETVASETSTRLSISPYTTNIQPTLPEPDSCWISLSAETPFDTAQDGTVRIEATGIRRPAPPPPADPPPSSYWIRCSLPGWLKSGQAKAHGSISCARADAIATAARNKPARAGNFLKAQGYWCRRHELRGTASVRCTRGTNIIRISGKLRR